MTRVSERSPLLQDTVDIKSNSRNPTIAAREYSQDPEDQIVQTKDRNSKNVLAVLCLLLIGVFIANADGSLVLATYGTISSEFNQLKNASWLTTSYILAMGATQPVCGKLSDIYGRKAVLQASYALFALGSIICGIGQSMWLVIVGRVISGLGGGGMNVVVSVLITDMVPLVKVASWRSYINVVATLGRSLGGPIGGVLADTIGWRWSFHAQAILTGIAMLSVAIGLAQPNDRLHGDDENDVETAKSKLSQVDFLGAILVSTTVVTFLMAMGLGGETLPAIPPVIIGLFVASLSLGTMFFLYESRMAKNPILPMRLFFERDVVVTFAIAGFQTAGQLGMMFSVPLYFQVTENASNVRAGMQLFPAVAGNAIGALLAGEYIKRSGHYKWITVISTLLVASSYILLILRWHRHINPWESLYILPSGFGTGIVMLAAFLAMTASVRSDDTAAAISGQSVCQSVGQVTGVTISSSVVQLIVRFQLNRQLKIHNSQKIIDEVISNVASIKYLDKTAREIVIECYIRGLEYGHAISLTFSVITFVLALSLREKCLKS